MNTIYKDMTKILHDGVQGSFELSHFTVGNNSFYDFFAYKDGICNGEYIRLIDHSQILNGCVMSNTSMEKRTNLDFCRNAHGDVFIAGLGIGLIVLAIQDKEDVESITIIEKEQDVIDLVFPQLPVNDKVKVIQGDIFDYEADQKYNTVYFDIWNYINRDVYEDEMKPLMKKGRKWLVKKSEDEKRWIDCWAKKQAQYNKEL